MGWGSAGSIFETAADALIESGAEYEVIIKTLVPLIEYLKGEDWDTVDESLEAYQRREGWGAAAVVQSLAETGEKPTYCDAQDFTQAHGMGRLRYVCCLYEGHQGKHRPTVRVDGEWT